MLICGLVFGRRKYMCCKGFWKRVVPFVLTLIIGLLAVTILPPQIENQNYIKLINEIAVEEDSGISACNANGFPKVKTESVTMYFDESKEFRFEGQTPLKIISSPAAKYTEKARQNNTEGYVILQVTFLVSGKIGKISTVKSLPDGLTEQAINAVKQITFEPARGHGTPGTTTKTVIYTFFMY